MTYDIYRLETSMGMTQARECLAHCENEEQLNEWRNQHPEMKGKIFVGRNWDD